MFVYNFDRGVNFWEKIFEGKIFSPELFFADGGKNRMTSQKLEPAKI